jgi:hypothetical protein
VTSSTGLFFGTALEALKAGKKIKRAHWGGYWVHIPAATTNGLFQDGIIVAVLKDDGGCAPAQPYQADMLAEDWEVIE